MVETTENNYNNSCDYYNKLSSFCQLKTPPGKGGVCCQLLVIMGIFPRITAAAAVIRISGIMYMPL